MLNHDRDLCRYRDAVLSGLCSHARENVRTLNLLAITLLPSAFRTPPGVHSEMCGQIGRPPLARC